MDTIIKNLLNKNSVGQSFNKLWNEFLLVIKQPLSTVLEKIELDPSDDLLMRVLSEFVMNPLRLAIESELSRTIAIGLIRNKIIANLLWDFCGLRKDAIKSFQSNERAFPFNSKALDLNNSNRFKRALCDSKMRQT